MTAFLRKATSDLLMWLGWDSATARGFGLGRPGAEWLTWSLRTPLVPATARGARPSAAQRVTPAAKVCFR